MWGRRGSGSNIRRVTSTGRESQAGVATTADYAGGRWRAACLRRDADALRSNRNAGSWKNKLSVLRYRPDFALFMRHRRYTPPYSARGGGELAIESAARWT